MMFNKRKLGSNNKHLAQIWCWWCWGAVSETKGRRPDEDDDGEDAPSAGGSEFTSLSLCAVIDDGPISIYHLLSGDHRF